MIAKQVKTHSKATRYRRIIGASAALCATLILSACGGGGNSTSNDNNPGNPSGPAGPIGPTGNTVSAAVQSANVVGVVGKQPGTTVTVNFMTTTGTATNLTIDTSLPAGWTAASANVCASVANTNGCAATLTYTPTTATSSAQTLTLTYHYTDNQGQAQSGTTTLGYAARQAFLYVAQLSNSPLNVTPGGGTFGPGSIQRCVTDSDGSLDSCSDSGATGVQAPVRIVFSGNDAYVSQINDAGALVGGGSGAETGSVLHCTADPATGALGGCADSGVTGLIFPIGLAVQGTDLYVLDTNASSPGQALQRCQIGSNGALANCTALTPSGPSGISLLGAASLAFNNGNLYFVGSGADAAVRCPINTDGSLGACSITPANVTPGGVGTSDIKFNGMSAYLSGLGGELLQCPANGDGTLGSCTSTALPAASPGGNSVPYGVGFVGHVAYIASLLVTGTGLTQCALNDDGTVGTCAVLATPVLNAPLGLATY